MLNLTTDCQSVYLDLTVKSRTMDTPGALRGLVFGLSTCIRVHVHSAKAGIPESLVPSVAL